MPISLLAFDFDGVILESVDAKTQAFAKIAESFGAEARDRLVLYHHLHGGVSRFEKFRWLYTECLGREASFEELEKMGREFAEYALDNVLNAPMVPGALDVLEHWKGRIPMVVCSGTPHEELQTIIKHRGLDRYFLQAYGTPPAKANLLRQATIDTRVNPADTVMVGDSNTDLEAAEIVGTQFYGRGEAFEGTAYPCAPDLTHLNAWLEAQEYQ